MIAIVITLNFLIAMACLYGARYVWRLRLSLAKAALVLENAERSTHAVLSDAPNAIAKGQVGIYQLREQYRQLQPQLQQAQRALTFLSLGLSLWQGRSPFTRRLRASQRKSSKRNR